MKRYICAKENNDKVSCYLNFTHISGFRIRPKNNVKYEGITVSRMLVTNPKLIKNVLKRKTKRKLNAYLQFLIRSLEEDDTSGEDLALILEDAMRYRMLIITKYSKFLEPAFIKQLLLRVSFIEEELKTRIMSQNRELKSLMSRGR